VRQVHIVSDIRSKSGGLGLAALQYATALADLDVKVILYSAIRFDDEWIFNPKSNLTVMGLTEWNGKSKLRILFEQVVQLRALINEGDVDLIHIHGCWTPVLIFAKLLARINRIPYFISPHGCLERWALNHKWFKKKIAYFLYQKNILTNSSMIIVTSERECESIRELGLINNIAIIPLGIEVPTQINRPSLPYTKNTILFLSRIHEIKGVEDLIIAWSFIRNPNWRVIIAGTGNKLFLDYLKEKIVELDLMTYFDFVGEVVGGDKEDLFARASIFVLPSYSENFGIAVGEALVRGVPVITTNQTPWRDIVNEGCGWCIDPGPESLRGALMEAISCSGESLVKMGLRGREFILNNYTLDALGRKALAASLQSLDTQKNKNSVFKKKILFNDKKYK
jgi:glycosyltransferase involved in cell wall biosynthesis